MYLVYYFLGIYLIIAVYALLPKTYNRYAIMLGIHLVFTVPSSFFLARRVLFGTAADNDFGLAGLTVLLSALAVLLSGIIVRKIRRFN